MSKRIVSIENPDKYGYLVFSDGELPWRDYQGRHVARWAAVYETLGDGRTQHAPERPVSIRLFGDFCVSVATEALADEAVAEIVRQNWPSPPARNAVLFLASIRHRPDKVQYYTTHNEYRLSTSRSKANDRRWTEVPT